ncbi:MAG TPA: S9 family peptidase [Puia sp.]|nr:S9 family peptidase [Puia sp.]
MTTPSTQDSGKWPGDITPPLAATRPHERTLHGDTVSDNYYWLIDYFRKGPDSDQVIDYLKAENTYLDAMMSGTKEFRDLLFTEMKARIKEKDESVPVYKNGYYYYTRSEEGQQYFKYCRKKETLDAPEEILLDVDEMAKGHAYYSATGFKISEDNNLLAFGVDTVSRRQYIIYIKDLASGQLYKEAIPSTSGNLVWANDNQTIFYTENNPVTLLTEKIRRHTLGTDPSADTTVYEEKDNSNYIGLKKSKSGKFIFIVSSATLSSEIRFIDASQPQAEFALFQPRLKDVLYEVDHQKDKFYIITNWDAKNFRLMKCPLDRTDRSHWKEVLPHRTDVLLEDIEVFADFLVITERKHGLIQLRIRNLTDIQEHYLDFGEPAYMASTGANPDYNSRTLRYGYTSLTTPVSTYDYGMDTKEKKLLKQQEVVGGYNPSDYTTERLYATGKDGVSIPISLVYRKGFKKDGTDPLLLYAYGSYGHSMDASFSSTRLSLLNRGFVFAIAHIRGGQEMGRYWYEDGKMLKKINTFQDFIDCGEYLLQQQYTGKDHLYAQGGSAGGLLMGAVANMRPDLWHGLVAQVPFVDVINTMLDESIPLTTNEYDEWGNPQNEEAYIYMKSYSPYENIEKKDYPNILVTTGLHDSQVQYFEPAKWVAKLRALKTDRNALLLQTEMNYGHGGASGRFDYLKDIALVYAFLFTLEGIRE